jgi:hypothetical protein
VSAPRRRIIRPVVQQTDPQNQVRVQKLRIRLEHERAALLRWQARMKRSFNAVQKTQKRVARIERQLAQLEES